MFNNSNAFHLHFLATLEVLFLQFMMNNKDSIAGNDSLMIFFDFICIFEEKKLRMGLKLGTQNPILVKKKKWLD